MSDDDHFEVCGTGQLAMQAVAAELAFGAALRAWARGDVVRAKPLIARAVQGFRHSLTIRLEHARYADFLFGGPSPRCGESVVSDLERVTKELDEQISRAPIGPPEWPARTRVQRAHSALLLGDHARAEELYVEAMRTLGAVWGEDHLEVGSYADDHATLLFRMGRHADAEAQIARARRASEKAGFPYRGRG
jgi:hypothetical protein